MALLLKFRGESVDSAYVSEEGRSQREDVLAAMLRHERGLVAAVASDGVLLPMPESVPLSGDRVMAAPGDRATMLD